eukprot:GHVT01026192.1.p1 GENE.GHVT01026192.1~~GHVT01026192.1.p1  ORF type:complete len:118 (+),score=2.80 GHVT01026192.1:231-584(+)
MDDDFPRAARGEDTDGWGYAGMTGEMVAVTTRPIYGQAMGSPVLHQIPVVTPRVPNSGNETRPQATAEIEIDTGTRTDTWSADQLLRVVGGVEMDPTSARTPEMYRKNLGDRHVGIT